MLTNKYRSTHYERGLLVNVERVARWYDMVDWWIGVLVDLLLGGLFAILLCIHMFCNFPSTTCCGRDDRHVICTNKMGGRQRAETFNEILQYVCGCGKDYLITSMNYNVMNFRYEVNPQTHERLFLRMSKE